MPEVPLCSTPAACVCLPLCCALSCLELAGFIAAAGRRGPKRLSSVAPTRRRPTRCHARRPATAPWCKASAARQNGGNGLCVAIAVSDRLQEFNCTANSIAMASAGGGGCGGGCGGGASSSGVRWRFVRWICCVGNGQMRLQTAVAVPQDGPATTKGAGGVRVVAWSQGEATSCGMLSV